MSLALALTVAARIATLSEEGLSNSEIETKIAKELTRDEIKHLTFDFCAAIDTHLGRTSTGGYWRKAYDWPIVGSVVFEDRPPVNDCGFFTFDII